MSKYLSVRILGPAGVAAAALVLGGCGSMTTYGTGKTAAAQTIEDVSGILSLSGAKKEQTPIVYAPRAPIVEPPTIASLPPPGGDPTVVASDWPTDPDEESRRMAALVKERAESGETLKFTLPDSDSKPDMRGRNSNKSALERLRAEKRQDSAQQKQLFAQAKMAKTGSFDAQGNPVRRYLTEPPVDYREPDPESPVVITETPKKKKFSWASLWPF